MVQHNLLKQVAHHCLIPMETGLHPPQIYVRPTLEAVELKTMDTTQVYGQILLGMMRLCGKQYPLLPRFWFTLP